MRIFESFDGIIDLPYPAFEKKLEKLEEGFSQISFEEINEDALDEYFLRIKEEYNHQE